jgi:hypothetical protein
MKGEESGLPLLLSCKGDGLWIDELQDMRGVCGALEDGRVEKPLGVAAAVVGFALGL